MKSSKSYIVLNFAGWNLWIKELIIYRIKNFFISGQTKITKLIRRGIPYLNFTWKCKDSEQLFVSQNWVSHIRSVVGH